MNRRAREEFNRYPKYAENIIRVCYTFCDGKEFASGKELFDWWL
jgi:hypothetical protein